MIIIGEKMVNMAIVYNGGPDEPDPKATPPNFFLY